MAIKESKMNQKLKNVILLAMCSVIPSMLAGCAAPKAQLLVAEKDAISLLQLSTQTASLFCDRPGRVEQSRNQIFVSSRRYLTVLHLNGTVLRQIPLPKEVPYFINFTILPNNAIALLNNNNDKVYFVDSEGKYLKTIDILQKPDRHLQNMHGIVVNNSLLISENGHKQIVQIDLSSYDVSIFRDLSHLGGWLGAIGYNKGTYYVCQAKKIFSFTKEADVLQPVAELPEGNITGIVINDNKAYLSVNGVGKAMRIDPKKKFTIAAGAVYQVDLITGHISVVKEGLKYPKDLALLLVR